MSRVQPVGFEVAQARIKKGWTQEHMADVCGISYRTLRRAEASQPVSLRVAQAIRCALAPWPTAAASTASIAVGTRKFDFNGVARTEHVHVVAVSRGWQVALRYNVSTDWCLGADGHCRRIGDPKEVVFSTQADAIVAAVCRLEYFRRINHPVLCARRRRAWLQGLSRLPSYDVWSDAFMTTLDERPGACARDTGSPERPS